MDETGTTIEAAQDCIALTADVVSAYVANNNVPVAELPALVATIHAALSGLTKPAAAAEPAAEKPTPAQIRRSITHEALISFLDGKPYKTLKRHLTTNGLTVAQYRERFGLPRDYPLTAASYSQARSALARGFGLGQQRRTYPAPEASPAAAAPAEKPKRAGRPRKAEDPA